MVALVATLASIAPRIHRGAIVVLGAGVARKGSEGMEGDLWGAAGTQKWRGKMGEDGKTLLWKTFVLQSS
ncbi:hypothetical protein D8674_014170 [Pyrus ussuriensis x Pyrus communis]|uniref:Uncharacterized protein n=1 Tax=Pyrus ussuriensis x Pyrus communis TaxID=2448454 RepID=A0A5N5GWK8_9ROSA|nr:hypothetical protein D8674_014170 [Pyrus ussuriensis x Pyrus communis]